MNGQLQKLLNVDILGSHDWQYIRSLNEDHVGLALKYMDFSQNGGFTQPEELVAIGFN